MSKKLLTMAQTGLRRFSNAVKPGAKLGFTRDAAPIPKNIVEKQKHFQDPIHPEEVHIIGGGNARLLYAITILGTFVAVLSPTDFYYKKWHGGE